MAHRKFAEPRRGNLGYLPRKRCTRGRGRCKTFPRDTLEGKPHLTAFLGFKAGTTHVMRLMDMRGSTLHNQQAVETATVLDAPPMVCCGIVGYARTPAGMRPLTTVWAAHISDAARRRFYKRWCNSKKAAFARYAEKAASGDFIREQVQRMRETCSIIRIIAHSQPHLTPRSQKKADIMEIQVNGGASVAAKVDYAYSLLEKEIPLSSVFKANEQIDTISITRGRGFEGVTTRWGTTRLPRKTRRGNRKVACIGAWHPANVHYTVARAGQMGYFHRVEANKQIFMVDTATNERCCTTEFDRTSKGINPMGGFCNYGKIRGDFLMIRGSCPGAKGRVVLMRKALLPRRNLPPPGLQWICTASKQGHGVFETSEEKKMFYASK